MNATAYDTALVVEPFPPTDSDGFRRAWTWLEQRQREVGGQILVYALWFDHPGLAGYRDNRCVRLASHKSARGVLGWEGGPVLALNPNRESVGTIAEDPRTRALCVLTSQHISTLNCVDGWRLAARPRPLGAVPPVTAHPDAIDAVAVAGLRAIQAVIEADPDGLSRQRTERARILARLRAAGRCPGANDAYAWALVNGWSARAAEVLRSMAGNVHAHQSRDEPGHSNPVDPGTQQRLDHADSSDH
jgi:hypothetical protein